MLVLHAKAPTVPRTFNGERVMGVGQMRYWSLCSNNSTTSQFYACVNVGQIPIEASGYYTVAISTAAARPTNATTACGVAWLPAGPEPRTTLLMRNMLPVPSFTQAIQNINDPKKVAETMGAYYPGGRYFATAADFEATGCHPTKRTRPGHARSRQLRGR